MKTKTKNRIKAALKFSAFAFLAGLVFFMFFLSVGTYGQVRYNTGFMNGYLEDKKRPLKTGFLPNGAIEANSLEHSTLGYRDSTQ